MQDLSLHLLDIIENSARARSTLIEISIGVLEQENRIVFNITDNGCGMDAITLENAQNPFYTSKSERQKKVGLGIPLFKQNAEWCNGHFEMSSALNEGTILKAEFEYDHIDRMPLGNVQDTILGSIIGHSDIDFYIRMYRILKNNECREFILDTRMIKSELGDIPITWPDVIQYLNDLLKEGIKNIKLEEF
jgi:signal transduction histidine kinase